MIIIDFRLKKLIEGIEDIFIGFLPCEWSLKT